MEGCIGSADVGEQEVNPDGDVEVSRRPDGDLELPGGGAGFLVPPCERCGGVLKPNVVFFGDAIPPARAKLCAPRDLFDSIAVCISRTQETLLGLARHRSQLLPQSSGSVVNQVSRDNDEVGIAMAGERFCAAGGLLS